LLLHSEQNTQDDSIKGIKVSGFAAAAYTQDGPVQHVKKSDAATKAIVSHQEQRLVAIAPANPAPAQVQFHNHRINNGTWCAPIALTENRPNP